MGGLPSVPKDRSRTLEVIGAGYSRTGTVSMALALERLLDGPVMHGGTQLFGREDAYVRLWCDIFRHRRNRPVLLKLLRQATAGFVAITDSPGLMFLPELLELYPDAKVVLVTRDPDRWFRSCQTILDNITALPRGLLAALLYPCPTWRWAPTWLSHLGQCEAERLGTEMTKDRLAAHNRCVRALVSPPEKLLTMELGQGWRPLAEFLGRPVPDEPFPHANESAAADAFARHVYVCAGLTWLAILCAVGAVVWAAWRLSSGKGVGS